jgi:hypothetical protein
VDLGWGLGGFAIIIFHMEMEIEKLNSQNKAIQEEATTEGAH